MEVSVTGDQAALTATDPNVVLSVNFEEGNSFKNLAYNESGFPDIRNDVMNLLNQHGITVTSSGENRFQLIMTNASVQNLELSRGTWEISIKWKKCIRGERDRGWRSWPQN